MAVRQAVYVGILVLCIGLMFYQWIRRGGKGLTDLLLRFTGGLVGILFTNVIANLVGWSAIGMNPFSLSVLGGLGIPGVVLLYLLLNLQYM